MTGETIRELFREWGCHAYQAELAVDFLSEDSSPHHLLLTPPGLGKVLIASQIVRYVTEHEQARRVLVIAPSAFCMLWRARLEVLSTTVPVKLMYGQVLRESATAEEPGDERWSEPIVAIVPCDTALRADIGKTLASGHWDLVILAEVQPLSRCQPLGLYQEMLGKGAIRRSLLISSAPPEPACDGSQTPMPEFQVTNWLGELLDWDGNAIELPPIKWRVCEYTRREREIHFHRLLQEQFEQSVSTQSPFRFETELLVRRAASSPWAVRRTLEIMGRKLSRTSLQELGRGSEKQYGDPTEVEDVPKLSFSPQARKAFLKFVQEAYDAFQQMGGDTKLACLLSLLDELAESEPGAICVISGYADTASYLNRVLREIGRPSVAINGGLRYAERQQAMKDFVSTGGILLATPGALGEESDLNRVKHVVHYDLAASRSQMAQLEGRFGRINRTHPCRMYALRDLSAAVSEPLPVEELICNGHVSHVTV